MHTGFGGGGSSSPPRARWAPRLSQRPARSCSPSSSSCRRLAISVEMARRVECKRRTHFRESRKRDCEKQITPRRPISQAQTGFAGRRRLSRSSAWEPRRLRNKNVKEEMTTKTTTSLVGLARVRTAIGQKAHPTHKSSMGRAGKGEMMKIRLGRAQKGGGQERWRQEGDDFHSPTRICG